MLANYTYGQHSIRVGVAYKEVRDAVVTDTLVCWQITEWFWYRDSDGHYSILLETVHFPSYAKDKSTA